MGAASSLDAAVVGARHIRAGVLHNAEIVAKNHQATLSQALGGAPPIVPQNIMPHQQPNIQFKQQQQQQQQQQQAQQHVGSIDAELPALNRAGRQALMARLQERAESKPSENASCVALR